MNDSSGKEWVPVDTFGARLALIRQRMQWNVKEAAEACGLVDQSWRNWEDGMSPRKVHDVARQIAERTGCDYTWLVAGGPLRSRCFSAIAGTLGQLPLFEDGGPAWSDRATLRVAG